MAKEMPGRLVALSASAVAVIYLAGLASTQSTADGVSVASAGAGAAIVATPDVALTSTAVAPTSTAILAAAAAPTATASISSTAVRTTAASPTTATSSTTVATAAPATTGTYANGTYSGAGTSRFGNVNVSVTIAGGKIANVQITSVTTKYPASRIASLPGLAVQSQTANVNAVTGATSSSQAFKQAAQQALTQALAANSTTAVG
jgi:uncharacterized protein with FMN-binding domain